MRERKYRKYTTKELLKMLAGREGVNDIFADAHSEVLVVVRRTVDGEDERKIVDRFGFEGPVVIVAFEDAHDIGGRQRRVPLRAK
jgi:hypothetical protein